MKFKQIVIYEKDGVEKSTTTSNLIAVASSDGKTIHQHFGRTTEFHIVSINENGYNFVETRTTEPCCNQFGHHEQSFDNILNLLNDCVAIVTGKIGYGASEYLTAKGMRIFETVGYADDILNEICHNQSHYFSKKGNLSVEFSK
jgi:predicted Fe-Mo cluster-binding NifX family protein